MIYEHGNQSTRARQRQRRHRFDRAIEQWQKRWGRRFRRRMLERARATNVWREIEQMMPYRLIPFAFTRRYLMRSTMNEELVRLRPVIYLQVVAREIRGDGGHRTPVIHGSRTIE